MSDIQMLFVYLTCSIMYFGSIEFAVNPSLFRSANLCMIINERPRSRSEGSYSLAKTESSWGERNRGKVQLRATALVETKGWRQLTHPGCVESAQAFRSSLLCAVKSAGHDRSYSRSYSQKALAMTRRS